MQKLKVGDTYDGQTITKLWKGDQVVNSQDIPAWFGNNYQVEHIVFDQNFERIRPTNCANWFCDSEKLKDISGLYYLKTSEVTSMAHMFDNCSSLTGTLSVGLFDTSNVTDMSYMFSSCSNVDYIYLTGLNTEQVTNMEWMFCRCKKLRSLDLRTFDTRSVTSMSCMFHGCTDLAEINISEFNTANVTTMESMFGYCSALKELDLTNFNTANVKDMQYMFSHDIALTTITVGDGWTMENTENKGLMFYYATSLKGQKGTSYSYDAATDAEKYAHIDGGKDNPGLFWGVADVALTDLADNSQTLKQYGGHLVNVTYDREFVFVNTAPMLMAGAPYLVVVENGTINLSADKVKLWAMPDENVEESIVNSSMDTWGDSNDLYGWWRGTFHGISNEEGSDLHAFGLYDDGVWKIIRNDTEAYRKGFIPSFRAYFIPLEYRDSEAYATKFVFIEAGDEGDDIGWETLPDEFDSDIHDSGTGIKPVIHTIDDNNTHRYYDLQGRQLPRKPQRGIYIDNGVKHVSK